MDSEIIAVGIAGVISPFAIEYLKNLVGWKKQIALLLSIITAIIIGFIAILIGSFFDPAISFSVTGMGGVWAVSQIVYNLWK